MHVILAHDVLAIVVQGYVEARYFTQRRRGRFQQERYRGQLHTALLRFRLHRLAEFFQLGDIGVVELGDVGHVQPVAGHIGGGQLVDLAHRLGGDRAKLAEIDLRHRRDTNATADANRATLGFLHLLLDVSMQVVLGHTVAWTCGLHLVEGHAQLARQFAHRRTGINLCGRSVIPLQVRIFLRCRRGLL